MQPSDVSIKSAAHTQVMPTRSREMAPFVALKAEGWFSGDQDGAHHSDGPARVES